MALYQQTPAKLMEVPSAYDDWQRWFHEHGPKLLLCARQWTRSLADAEDVVQDAFVRYWRHQRGLDGDPMALLLTSIRRTAFDLARRDSRRVAREERSEVGSEPAFEFPPERDDRLVAIEHALERLPLEQREVLVLKIWGGRTFEQIAEHLDISPNTAASRYRYALGTLRKQMTSACHG